MGEKGTGAIILAAGKSNHIDDLRPMMKVGQTTMIQREIDTLRQADISPIVVVTGYQAEVLEKHISHRGAVVIRNKRYRTSQMFDSICQGLRYIQKKVDRVLLFPSDIPMVSVETVLKMKETEAEVAIPVFEGQTGHPVMLDRSVIPAILEYKGERGLRGAMEACGKEVVLVEITDRGVVMDTNTAEDYEDLLEYAQAHQRKTELSCRISVMLKKETDCFGQDTAGFLEAIRERGSMLSACQSSGISYSKGWKMIKQAEDQLGIRFITRQTGGKRGGSSTLTKEGEAFLEQFRLLEEQICRYAKEAFAQTFRSFMNEAASEGSREIDSEEPVPEKEEGLTE